MSNSLSLNVIRTLFFFIQSLSRIMSLEIDLTYIIIYYWFSNILNQFFIYFLKMTFSFVIVLISISYLTKMIFSLFFQIHVLNITIILVSKLISLSLVVILSSLFCMIIERIIRFSSSDSLSFLELLRFLTYRRLQE